MRAPLHLALALLDLILRELAAAHLAEHRLHRRALLHHLHLHEEVVERHRARLEPVLHAFRLLVGEAGVAEAHLLHHLAADRAACALRDITDGAANIL